MTNKSIITLSIAIALTLSSASFVFAQAKDAEALVKEGDRLYREGRYEEAAKVYEEAYILIKTAPRPAGEKPLRKEAESPESVAEKGDALFREKRFIEAADAYGQARDAYRVMSETAAFKLERHKRKLEILKMRREQKRREKREAEKIKKIYIKELKALRKEDIARRRAEGKTSLFSAKKEAAKNWQAVREEKKKYKLERARKKVETKAERDQLRLARERLKEEEKVIEEMTKGLEAAVKGPEVIKELKMVSAYGVEKEPYTIKVEEPKKAVPKIVVAKERAQEAAIAALEKKESVSPPSVAGETQVAAKEELVAKREEISLAKEAERQERFRQKAALIRERINRIEEAMFMKRQEKEAKRRAELKHKAIKKAGSAKQELDKSILMPEMDKKAIEKARLLIEKADNYFNREMYKEAGELYDRALLTLRGKLH